MMLGGLRFYVNTEEEEEKKKTNFFSNSTHLFEQSLSQAVNSQSNTSEMPYFEWSNAAVHNDAVCFIIIQKQM